MFRRYLGNLKQTYLAIVVNKSTTLSTATPLVWGSLEQRVSYLDISFGLIGNLHNKLSLSVNHMLKNLFVNAASRQY